MIHVRVQLHVLFCMRMHMHTLWILFLKDDIGLVRFLGLIRFAKKKNNQNRYNTTGITVTNDRDCVLTVITMLPGDNKDDNLEAKRFGNDEEGQQEGKSPQRSRLVRRGSIESGKCFAGAKSG